MRDPLQPLVYDNMAFLWNAARRWLIAPRRRPCHTLGLGTDRSDSLLFEGVTEHARHLIPMFADAARNPHGCKLFLLTKSKNTNYLEGLPTTNTIVTFSLNPEPIADLWEGKWPDTLERITPPIAHRLAASLHAQSMGFEVRWRIDPILTPIRWEAHYAEFFRQATAQGHRPSRITLGTYRQTHPQLDLWRKRWRLPPMEWRPEPLTRDGTHWHPSAAYRSDTYKKVAAMCGTFLPESVVSLCKETKSVRRDTGLCSPSCNCLA
jgi:DNA repair photolyase